MLHVGYKNYVSKDKILAITRADSAPLRRIRLAMRNENKLVECTNGKETKSLIFLRDGTIVASANTTKTLKENMEAEWFIED